MDILRAENIVKNYSGHTALKNVSITVPANCIFGLLGPNGAGKTSFIRVITQILSPDSGTVYFKGEKLSPKHISRIGYLPEERGLYKKMQVGEQLIYLGRLRGLSVHEAKNKLEYWMHKMDLATWQKKKVEDLSKGMQQKVQFIATVMHEPELIILDEPFSGFDPINAELIKGEILDFKKKGASIILSTHRMESVEELCDYFALINKSEKILEGSVQEIKQKFKKEIFVVEGRGTLGNSSLIEILTTENLKERVRIRFKAKAQTAQNEILREVIQTMEVINFKEEIPSVNDIFMLKVKGEK